MRERVLGYWALSWSWVNQQYNCATTNCINNKFWAPLKVANITLAISLGWPAAIVGIVSSAALLAERNGE